MARHAVFLSYKRGSDTTPAVEKFYNRIEVQLAKYGTDLFLDYKSIEKGDLWEARIDSFMARATLFVAFISIDFHRSQQCRRELDLAIERYEKEGMPRPLCVLAQALDPNDLRLDDDMASCVHKIKTLGQIDFLGPHDPRSRKLVPLELRNPTKLDRQLAALLDEIKRPKETGFDRPSRPQLQANGLLSTGNNQEVRTNDIPAPEHLIGRDGSFLEITSALASRQSVVIVYGPPGVGKSYLAIDVANAYAGRDERVRGSPGFDSIVWLSAAEKFSKEKILLGDVLKAIVATVGGAAFDGLPTGEEEGKKALAARLLRCSRVLVILDNFETIRDPSLHSWLAHIPVPSKVLITTTRLVTNLKAKLIHLRGLNEESVRELLFRQLDLASPKAVDDRIVKRLTRDTGGNPKAIELMIGWVRSGARGLSSILDEMNEGKSNGNMKALFDKVFSISWKLLKEDGRSVLLVTPLFAGAQSIGHHALQAMTGLERETFRRGLTECIELFLIEPDPGQVVNLGMLDASQFVIHPLARSFARSKLDSRQTFETESRQRGIAHYLDFVRRNVRRPMPDAPYWNSLVSDGMLAVDPEWLNVDQAIRWAMDDRHDKEFIEFVMLLVHYMDSRYLNVKRLSYVERAISLLVKTGRLREAALLQIDAQGWTLIEEGRLDDADRSIVGGLERLEEAGAVPADEEADLRTLALTWRARIQAERGSHHDAQTLVNEALSLSCSPWIRYRVNMVAGDVALKTGHPSKALDYYKAAKVEAGEYEPGSIDGEAHGYQILPRIGAAYLADGDIPAAQKEFQRLSCRKEIAIGKFHADYGFAVIAYENDQETRALRLLRKLQADLSRGGNFALLMTSISGLLLRLDRGRCSSTP